MDEYISRTELVENLDRFAPEHLTPLLRSLIEKQPTADVVLREVMEQIKWERDIAIEQLASYGVCLGEKKELAEVKHGEWIYRDSDIGWKCYECSICNTIHTFYDEDPLSNCCSQCGAKMDGRRDE